ALGDIPRPAYWSGFRIKPSSMEFWSDKPFRLHDRVRFYREGSDTAWRKERLYP
ncbi:MAG: pyridoxine 5'-phosphate oxidase C-terminal domain-containing protein, partial [Methylocystis sp.]